MRALRLLPLLLLFGGCATQHQPARAPACHGAVRSANPYGSVLPTAEPPPLAPAPPAPAPSGPCGGVGR